MKRNLSILFLSIVTLIKAEKSNEITIINNLPVVITNLAIRWVRQEGGIIMNHYNNKVFNDSSLSPALAQQTIDVPEGANMFTFTGPTKTLNFGDCSLEAENNIPIISNKIYTLNSIGKCSKNKFGQCYCQITVN